MTKDEIDKKVFELQSYEVIRHFIQQRIAELEAQSEERTVAQNYIDSFLDYASSKRYGNFSVNVNIKMYKKGNITMYKKGNIRCTKMGTIYVQG